jgi:hypothetical protein
MKICINNSKCENFLELNTEYEIKESGTREDCYSVLVKDKQNRIKGEKWFDFKKSRFE